MLSFTALVLSELYINCAETFLFLPPGRSSLVETPYSVSVNTWNKKEVGQVTKPDDLAGPRYVAPSSTRVVRSGTQSRTNTQVTNLE